MALNDKEYPFKSLTDNRQKYYSKECIKFVQNLLLYCQYKIGKSDGILGPKTIKSIKEFKTVINTNFHRNVFLDDSEIDKKLITFLVLTYLLDNYSTLEDVPQSEYYRFLSRFIELELIEK